MGNGGAEAGSAWPKLAGLAAEEMATENCAGNGWGVDIITVGAAGISCSVGGGCDTGTCSKFWY